MRNINGIGQSKKRSRSKCRVPSRSQRARTETNLTAAAPIASGIIGTVNQESVTAPPGPCGDTEYQESVTATQVSSGDRGANDHDSIAEYEIRWKDAIRILEQTPASARRPGLLSNVSLPPMRGNVFVSAVSMLLLPTLAEHFEQNLNNIPSSKRLAACRKTPAIPLTTPLRKWDIGRLVYLADSAPAECFPAADKSDRQTLLLSLKKIRERRNAESHYDLEYVGTLDDMAAENLIFHTGQVLAFGRNLDIEAKFYLLRKTLKKITSDSFGRRIQAALGF